MLDREETIRGADAQALCIVAGEPGIAEQPDAPGPATWMGVSWGALRRGSGQDRYRQGLARWRGSRRFDTGQPWSWPARISWRWLLREPVTAMLERVARAAVGHAPQAPFGVLVCRADDASDHGYDAPGVEAAARQGLAGIAVAGLAGCVAAYEDVRGPGRARPVPGNCRVGDEG